MVYKAALKMVIADGKPCLTRNQAFLMSVLVANADGFNELDLDTDFFNDFMEMSDPKIV